MLVNEGVLLSRRGGGTFVRFQHEPWSEQNIVQPLKTLLADDPDYSFDILEARHAIERQHRVARGDARHRRR